MLIKIADMVLNIDCIQGIVPERTSDYSGNPRIGSRIYMTDGTSYKVRESPSVIYQEINQNKNNKE